jgi:uncharacterized membrane protein
MDVVTIIALVFLIISWVISAMNRELSSTNFALWSIAVIMVLRGVNLV